MYFGAGWFCSENYNCLEPLTAGTLKITRTRWRSKPSSSRRKNPTHSIPRFLLLKIIRKSMPRALMRCQAMSHSGMPRGATAGSPSAAKCIVSASITRSGALPNASAKGAVTVLESKVTTSNQSGVILIPVKQTEWKIPRSLRTLMIQTNAEESEEFDTLPS